MMFTHAKTPHARCASAQQLKNPRSYMTRGERLERQKFAFAFCMPFSASSNCIDASLAGGTGHSERDQRATEERGVDLDACSYSACSYMDLASNSSQRSASRSASGSL